VEELVEKPLDIDQKLCKGCGICYTLCPKKAIKGDEKGKVVVDNPDLCSKCGICESHCPDYAIFVRREKK
jgi:2-oxoglutarate ferredoxin oxidoreductase subunit delta